MASNLFKGNRPLKPFLSVLSFWQRNWPFVFLGFGISLIFIANFISLAQPLSGLEKLKVILLQGSLNPAYHLDLADLYIRKGDYLGASQEITLSEQLTVSLSEEQRPVFERRLERVRANLREIDPQAIYQELDYWKEVALENKTYPDAWAKLGLLWFRLDNRELARLAIDKAIELDPLREEFKKIQMEIRAEAKD